MCSILFSSFKVSFRSLWYFQWWVRGFLSLLNIADVSSGDFCVSGMVKDNICVLFCVSGTIMVMLSTWVLSDKVCYCICSILQVSPINYMMFWSIKSLSIDSSFSIDQSSLLSSSILSRWALILSIITFFLLTDLIWMIPRIILCVIISVFWKTIFQILLFANSRIICGSEQ